MGKIYADSKRLFLFLGILIVISFPLLFLIATHVLSIFDYVFFLFLELLIYAPTIYYRYIYRPRKIFFTVEYFVFNKAGVEYKIKWPELKIESHDLLFSRVNLKNLKFTSLVNPSISTYTDLSWVNEDSFVRLCETYVPKTHQLQYIIEDQRKFKGWMTR